MDVDQHLDAFEGIAQRLDEALTLLDAGMVEALVIEQCEWMNVLSAESISASQVARLREIKLRIQRQQAMIEQALSVTEFFLSRLFESSTITVAG